ncbi:FadR/GntR family transcriptional regulator [Kaistia dalseonensis]|uniref:DNA-binding FadR family transcriptional regulator n=1 Tax=Kaistia dalseonensis TaxID=410840 RepID=A0ABU0H3B4_9HYPH|nr:FadR/GntR family transcriptional regulator [Kaistia dalseonensis]MCX5494214.1 FadR/GntR family transcriptional regulator [Kaistia dalseonensis]MDQ0436793.1 DNA-binding FadR family transcriptional regulator [Kaistia dalseonensis]
MRGGGDTTRPGTAPGRDRSGSLSDRVASEIGRRIVSGHYQPGETLPTEPKVQEEFGVSRTAVREAVRLLSAKGLTVSRPKIGTKVRPRTDWNMLDPDVLKWQIDQRPSDEFIHSLFEMREIIEPAAAARAAERATPAEIEALRLALDGIQNRDRGSADQIKADLAFHMTVLEASHNPMIRSVGGLIESGLVISFSLGWRTVMGDDAVFQHRDVYEAIRDHNPDEAYLAMRRLLRNAKGNVFDSIWIGRSVEAGDGNEIR